jgi:hypothetical protein
MKHKTTPGKIQNKDFQNPSSSDSLTENSPYQAGVSKNSSGRK